MIAKFPPRFGFPEKVPASLLTSALEKHVPSDAFAEVVPRESKTVSFLLHNDFVDTVLRASGIGSVFYKLKKQQTDDVEKEMPLLWLDDSYDLDGATKLAEDRTAMGLVEKGNIAAARYGLRFQSLSDLETFAKYHQIDSSNASMGRWKLTGIPFEVGLAGAFAFLQTQNWNNIDIIFLAEIS